MHILKAVMKHWLLPLLLAAASIAGVYWRADGFSAAAIRVPLLPTEDAHPLSPTFAWPQTFTYLGRGNQAFAFESEDKKYVLKFFHLRQLKLPWYAPLTSQKWRERRETKARIFPESYPLAYQFFREETGLLHVHLGKNSQSYPSVTLLDRASCPFTIDLNEVPFILQEKADDPFPARLAQAKDSPAELRPLLDQYVAIHRKLIGASIGNCDRHINDNYRCLGNRLIYIDPGRIFFKKGLINPETLRSEWQRATHELRRWISQYAPSELPYFDALIKRSLEETREIFSTIN